MTKKQKDTLVKDREKIDRPKKYKVVSQSPTTIW